MQDNGLGHIVLAFLVYADFMVRLDRFRGFCLGHGYWLQVLYSRFYGFEVVMIDGDAGLEWF